MPRSLGWSGDSSTGALKQLVIENGTSGRSWSWPNRWPWCSSSSLCAGCRYTSWTASFSSARSVTYPSLPCTSAFSCPTWTQHSTHWFMHSGLNGSASRWSRSLAAACYVNPQSPLRVQAARRPWRRKWTCKRSCSTSVYMVYSEKVQQWQLWDYVIFGISTLTCTTKALHRVLGHVHFWPIHISS